jgi:hypothetical protein
METVLKKSWPLPTKLQDALFLTGLSTFHGTGSLEVELCCHVDFIHLFFICIYKK